MVQNQDKIIKDGSLFVQSDHFVDVNKMINSVGSGQFADIGKLA